MLLVPESANDKDLFYNNIVPVQLSPLELAEFKSVFFPKAPKKAGEDASDDGEDGEDGDGDSIKKEGGAAYEDLYNVLYELNNIGTRVNAAYAIARMCLQENANSSTKHPTYDWQQPFPEHLKNRAKSIIADYVAKSDEHFKDYSLPLFQEIKESYITNSSRGKAKLNKKHCVPYIIKPSVTHKNGYDVMWVGKTGNSFGNSPLLGAVSEFKGNRYYHPNFPESVVSIEYDSWTSKHRADESRYSIDDDAVQMMDIIEQLNIILTDGEASNIGSMHKRIFKVLPLDFDFKRINKLLLQNLQIKPFENLIAKNLNASVPRLAALKSHFSILVIVNPNPSVVTEVVRSITNKKSFDPADKLATQVLKTSPDISFSLVMHLSEKESHYITQTPANEVVSLVSLHQWVRQWSKYGFKGSRIMPPDHIVSAGLLSTFSEKRAKYGHYVEKGNNDKNNITVAYNGTLIYCPKLEHLGFVKNNAAEFEKSSNEILKQFYDKNICPNFDTLHVDQTVDAEQNAIVSDSLVENIRSMRKIKGTMLSCTWDYNRIIYASDDPSIISAIKLGGVTPDALALADYMNNPFEKGLSLTSKTVAVKQKGKTSDTNDEEMLDEEMYYGLSHALTTSVCKLYTNLYSKGLVKSFQELLNEAKEHFGIKSLIDDKLEGYEDGLYKDVMSSDLIEKAGVDYEEGRKILLTLQTALNNAAGYTNTKLYQVIARLVSSNEVDVTLKSSNRFFRSEERYEVKCKLSDYKNVYNWFGGYVYYLALCQIRDTGSKVFEINDIENYPTAAQLSTKIMPYVVMMSVYVKDSDDIYRKAEQLRERNRPLDKTREEINNQILVLGSTSTAQQLPHQVDEQKILRNRPKIVLLDCQAGGGKCSIGQTLIHTSKGIMRLDELWESAKGPVDAEGFKPLKIGVIDHTDNFAITDKVYKTSGKTIKITFSDGSEIEGLHPHKIWMYVNNVYQFVRLDEIEIGDALPKAIPTELYGKTQYVEGFEVGEEFAELLGLMVAEGYFGGNIDNVDNRERTLNFNNIDRCILQRFEKLWESVFGDSENLRLMFDKREQRHGGYDCSKSEYASIVKDLCVRGKSADRLVPLAIRQSPKHVQCAFLRALFEGDGSIYLRDGNSNTKLRWTIELCSLSKRLIFETKALLENIGILTNIRSKRAWATNGSDNQVEKDAWLLYIDTHSDAVRIFAEEIGFLGREKCKRLVRALEHYDWRNSNDAQQNTNSTVFGQYNNFPMGIVCESARNIIVDEAAQCTFVEDSERKATRKYTLRSLSRHGYELQIKSINNGGWCSRFAIERINSVVENGPKQIVKRLFTNKRLQRRLALLNQALETAWITVTNIEYSDEEVDVYDISVPGNHSYVANSIYSHNTITCLIDIACTMRECKAEKIAIKPLIIVPTQLVKNWCEDFIKIVGSNWNYIPINTEVVKRWGFERLHKMISDAPPNTVVIVAMDFLSKSNKYSVIVGDEVEKNSMSVEFIKNFGFNYIAIDEAHKLKTSDTATHILCKQICSMSNVKYLRLLSGTMIPNELKDIVGIASLCSGHIFRTGAEFEKLRAELAENGKFGDKDIVKRRAVGQLIRDRLKETVALITVKRKEWAFLLPSPIERFISVYLSFAEEERFMGDAASKPSSGEGSLEDVMSSTHRAVYEAVLGAAIAKLIQDIKGRKKGDDGDVIDGDDDDDDSSGSGKVKIKGKPPKLNPSTGKYEYDDDFEIDDDTLESMLSTSAGKYFYQRIDRVIMDPESDPLGAEMFDKLRETYPDMKFVSRKVKKIIEILNEHFTTPANWQRGKYKAYSLVTFDNKTFSAVNPHNDTKTFESILPPDRDTQNWKEETSGKVIIVTRYDRSVEGIYNNLPEDIKKMTITLYGQNSIFENKFNFKSFESDPNIKIMIANEQRITVGFNLQFASRIIRAEAPWTPGDLEQTNSRIFRPDPSGFLKGKMMRNVIWLDWIICDNTLEVIKMAKLYRKAIQNCQYEEGDNTDANGKNLYETIMEFDPPPLKLNKAKLQGDITLADIESTYIDPYSEYVGIRNEDFDTMRQKEDGCMIPMVYTEKVPDDFKVINNVPFVYSQKIPDPHNFEFESLNSFMGERTNANYLNTLLKYGLDSGIAKKQSTQRKIVPTMVSVEKFPLFKSLPSRTKDGQLIRDSKGKVVRKTLFVRYEGGYGTISGLGLSFRKEGVSPLEKLEITTIDHQKVIVDLKKTEVFICNNVDDLNFAIIKNSKSVDFGSTKIKSKITTLDDTIDSIIDVDDIEEVATPVRKPPSVSLIPAVYNRFVALEVVPEAGANIDAIQTILDQCASGMSGVGFFYHSNYAHIKVHNKASFKAIFAFLRDNGFQMSANSIPILKSLQAAFNKDTQQFAADLAPIGEMKTFFAASHKVANDKKSLKVYPLISSGSLQLLVDLNTNKHFRMLLNKPIEGINTNDKSFKKSDGMFLALVNNKAQLAAMIGSVKKSKLNIVNADDLKNLYLNLKTHTGEDVK